MCGICGWLSLNGSQVDDVVFRQMIASLAHRGPNDEGFYSNGHAALGQRRLSIIDLAAGHQPLANEDGTIWVTYNGEIYNYPDLMDDLIRRGHRFRTRSDTEVIVHAYEEFGIECLSRFNGMYAFALWDERTRRLLLARDPFGIKPLYVWRDNSHLLFSSEIKAFLADPSFPRELDPIGLDEYMTYQHVPAPRTIFKGVEKLRPGHCIIMEGGQERTLRFARTLPRLQEGKNEAEAASELQDHLFRAVKRQMISDVPVGALLSGGVDSATVVAVMRELTDLPVKTFTVGFDGNFAKDELASARRTAEIFGTEHHEVVLEAKDCLDAFDTVIWHMDEPVAIPSAMAMYWLSRLAAEHVKVVLTGQGADEPWAGYRRYRGESFGKWYRRAPKVMREQIIEPLVGLIPRAEALKRSVFALGVSDPSERFTNVYTVFTPAMKRALYLDGLSADLSESRPIDALRYWQSDVAHLDPLAQQLYIETRFSLADSLLLYGDKMAMAASLEARVPLLDLELMDFVESLPPELKLKGISGHKYLYRKAITHWLPDEILKRPKIGFATPVDDWFQREITGFVRERLTTSGSACSRYFDTKCITAMIEAHAARSEDYTRPLFSLLVFEAWHEQFMS